MISSLNEKDVIIDGKHRIFSQKHKDNISKGLKKHLGRMTKEERRKYFEHWVQAGHKATKKKMGQMTEEEMRKFIEPMNEAHKKKLSQMTEEEKSECYYHWIKAGQEASQKANPSSIEKLIWKELDELGVKYETQVPFNHGKFIADIYAPIWKLIIECNGDYYHNYKMFPQSRVRDKALEKYLVKKDYKIIWLWEHEIRKNPKQILLRALLKVNIDVWGNEV